MNYFIKKEKLLTSVSNLYGYVKNTIDESTEELQSFMVELENLNFNVLCLGDFSSGKTTFINNFFLENKVKLPVKATVTTAKLTIIKYGKELKVIAVMNDGSRVDINENVEESLKEVVASKGSKLNEVNYVEVQLPSSILKEGVVVVDSPGLNDPEIERMDVTFRFVNKADCVLYFLNASQAWKKSEKEFLEEKILCKEDLDKVFFLLNYFDVITDEDDRKDIIDYVNNEISKSISVIKNNLNNSNISTPPLIPISAKTGENFDKLKAELFTYLSNKKAQDILDAKIKKYNAFVDTYIDSIRNKRKLIEKNNQELMAEIQKKEAELNEYKLKSDEVKKRIIKNISNSYDEFINNLKYEYQFIVENFKTYLSSQEISNSEEFKKFYKIALKKAELLSNDSLQIVVDRFKKEIVDIFEKERSELNIPMNKIIDNNYLLAKVTNIKNFLDNEKINKKNIAASIGILASLGGAGSGIAMLTSSSTVVTPATSGILSSVWTGIVGSSATTTTVAGMSTLGIITTVAIPTAILAGLSYVAIDKVSKIKFQKDLEKAIENSAIELQETYFQKIQKMRNIKEEVSDIIAQNISNEFINIYKEKLEEYKKINEMKKDNSNFNGIEEKLASMKLFI